MYDNAVVAVCRSAPFMVTRTVVIMVLMVLPVLLSLTFLSVVRGRAGGPGAICNSPAPVLY